MDVHTLIANPPKLHTDGGSLTSSWNLGREELLFLDENVKPGQHTLETGLGVSTIVFALKGSNHVCITPDQREVTNVCAFCSQHGISLESVKFINECSEYALPKMNSSGVDVALIDGRHAFPTPFIDWYYIANMMSVGGIVLVDDLHIWTCELLAEFMHADDDWQIVRESLSAAIFKKRREISRAEYAQQPYVFRRSRQASLTAKLRYLAGLLRRRNYSLLSETLRLVLESALKGNFGVRER